MRLDDELRRLLDSHPDPPRPIGAGKVWAGELRENWVWLGVIVLCTVFGVAVAVGGEGVIGLSILAVDVIGVACIARSVSRSLAAARDGVLCEAVVDDADSRISDGSHHVRVRAHVAHPSGRFAAKGMVNADHHGWAAALRAGDRVAVLTDSSGERVLRWLGPA